MRLQFRLFGLRVLVLRFGVVTSLGSKGVCFWGLTSAVFLGLLLELLQSTVGYEFTVYVS